MVGTRWLKWLLIPLAIAAALTLVRDGGGFVLQDYLNMVVKLLDGTVGVVLEAIFRAPLEWVIARINDLFHLNFFLQDHWKPAFFLLWLVFNNYVLATWNGTTGWPRLVWALVCALGGGVMAATVNLAHLSVFIWPAAFTCLFLAGAVAQSWNARFICLVVAGVGAAYAISLDPVQVAYSGTSASIGLLLMTIGVFATGLVFLVRGVSGHDTGAGDWWSNPGRQMGGYILLVLLGAVALLGVGDWTGPLFRTATQSTIADEKFDVVKDCQEAHCPEMILIPAGAFDMGADEAETAHALSFGATADEVKDEKPIHRVAVKRFWLSKTEVTRGQFRAFVEDTGYRPGRFCWGYDPQQKVRFLARNDWRNPGFEQNSDDHPVVCVTWHDAQAYVKWLSRKTGKRYRLPSEAEWEYAARAGTTTSRYWGQDNKDACLHANVADQTGAAAIGWNAGNEKQVFPCTDGHAFTAPVGRFKPNAFGLFDMLGNAWEWTEDHYSASYEGAPNDGTAWKAGEFNLRVLRGGSWYGGPWRVRSADRSRGGAADRDYGAGFRVARTD